MQNSRLALFLVRKGRSRQPRAPRPPCLPTFLSGCTERSFESERAPSACARGRPRSGRTHQPVLQPRGRILTDQLAPRDRDRDRDRDRRAEPGWNLDAHNCCNCRAAGLFLLRAAGELLTKALRLLGRVNDSFPLALSALNRFLHHRPARSTDLKSEQLE